MAPQERHFGIQEIYRPEAVEPEVDIVAVHGMNGDAVRTWTCPKNNVCWLTHPDFLPKYIDNARVLVWSYNSNVSNLTGPTPSHDKIHHHAQTLVAHLSADRRLERREKNPIIFICHSLGGLVVKQALAYASTRNGTKTAHLQSISTCTYGILFFGTPHHGCAKHTDYIRYAAMSNITLGRYRVLSRLQKLAALTLPSTIVACKPGLVTTLERDSEVLQNVTDYFVPLMKNYRIHFFWEQQKTKIRYRKRYIVSQTSAAPTFNDTERAGIAADHSGMVRFENSRSSSFRVVAAALTRYCEDGPAVIHDRCVGVNQHLEDDNRREAMEKPRCLTPCRRVGQDAGTFVYRAIERYEGDEHSKSQNQNLSHQLEVRQS